MNVLFVNACARKTSRTERLARAWMEQEHIQVTREIDLMDVDLIPFTKQNIDVYCGGVGTLDFSDPLFDYARQFKEADLIIMAAPLWNMALPARLHDYLELVCAQGVTFECAESGSYTSLIKAKRLVLVSTAGSMWPPEAADHAFGYLKTLSDYFWHIPEVSLVYAEGIDAVGADVEDVLRCALARSL